MRELGAGTQGQAAIGFQTIGAAKGQQAFGSEGIADGFGDAFADPIEILRLRVVKEGQNQSRPAVQRAAPQGGKQRQSAHSSLLYGSRLRNAAVRARAASHAVGAKPLNQAMSNSLRNHVIWRLA